MQSFHWNSASRYILKSSFELYQNGVSSIWSVFYETENTKLYITEMLSIYIEGHKSRSVPIKYSLFLMKVNIGHDIHNKIPFIT